MANGAAKAELTTGDTQSEFIRPQRFASEGAAKKSDRLGVSGALGALRLDKPDVQDRQDLKSLVAHGRKYRHFDTMDQYKNDKAKANGGPQTLRNEQVAQKQSGVDEVDESKRIYEEPHLDPMVREIQDKITTNTNLDPTVRSLLTSGSDNYTKLWYQVNESQNISEWQNFVRDHPDKAAAYAEKHPGIKAAMEDIERQELAAARAQTAEQLQSENNQLLADSVRVSDNNPEGLSDKPGAEQDQGEKPSPIVEVSGKETGLLSAETVGVQATLLLGGEIGTKIDKAKIEAIAGGGHINAERANKASLEEREDYWNGENSPFKSMSFEQQLEKWRGTMQAFFDQYKGEPEAEFFKRIGIDLKNENAVREIYQTYFVDGEGDLGLLTQKIAQNNSAEQIQENRDLIQKLGKMYGEKSAKVMVEMTMGVKNAQTDIDLFIKTARASFDEKNEESRIDLGNIASNIQEGVDVPIEAEQHVNTGESKGPEVEREENPEKFFSEAYSEAVDHKYYEKDKWRGNLGQISLDGNYISFTPTREHHGAFRRDTTWLGVYKSVYDPDLKIYNRTRIVVDGEKNYERGVELAVDASDSKTWDPKLMESTGMKMVPTPFMWELLETNPESVGKGGLTFGANAFGRNALGGKEYIPEVPSFYGIGGRDAELIGETTLGVMWSGINVDRETITRMQSQAIEYIEKQVQEGQMPKEMLDTAKGLIDSHKAPDKIKRALENDKGRGKTKENPKLYVSFLQGSETWNQKGQVRSEGNLIVYDNDEYRKKGERREVEIATTSIDTSGVIKEILTKQSWDILEAVPETDEAGASQTAITEATTNALLDRKGEWKKFVKPFRTDGATLSRMQQTIRAYIEAQVQQGKMDSSALVQVDSLLKFKQSTIMPIRTGDKVIYDLKGRRAKAVELKAVKREPRTLVEKITEGARNGEPVSSVTINDSDIRKYLMTKDLPMASITQLDIRFQGQTATMSGEIKAGFGFIKGKLDFSLGIANKADGSGLMVTSHTFETESNMIRSRLGDVESQLNNINGFIGDDINDQLQRINPNLRLLGLTISPEGTFLARVQNASTTATKTEAA